MYCDSIRSLGKVIIRHKHSTRHPRGDYENKELSSVRILGPYRVLNYGVLNYGVLNYDVPNYGVLNYGLLVKPSCPSLCR